MIDDVIASLRLELRSIAPYAERCLPLDKPPFSGTGFFPGNDGRAVSGEFAPIGGVLILGSDYGDKAWYDRQFADGVPLPQRLDSATERGLAKLLALAGIPLERCFLTNAWPCLREGDDPVKGGPPGARDKAFTQRCLTFFRYTLEKIQPSLVVPLGLLPTTFASAVAPEELNPWTKASSWKHVDRMPIGRALNTNFVPVVHPSMPNRRHRIAAKTMAQEADLLRNALKRSAPGASETDLRVV